METNLFQLTLKGNTFGEVIAQAKALVTEAEAFSGTTTRRGKKAATTPTPPIEESFVDATNETEEIDALEAATDTTSFDELEETPPPAKPKATKITDKEINAMAMAHAKKHGRKVTLELLAKKFKVKSILELKPEQFAAVIKALAV